MGRREDVVKKAHKLMYDTNYIRNVGIVAHIDHGKTTLTDNLLYGAGLLAEELAGKAVAMDSYILEAQRGITILSGNFSFVHKFREKDYLINLIDTPGHVDFGGQVTRALRAADGAIVVIDAVEGVMPQTETVLRQALKERVKPVLFINKVDRLINELQVTPEDMQNRFTKNIAKINELIKRFGPPEFRDAWQINVNNGSVSFGSAFNRWAISIPFMKRTNTTFKDIYDACKDQKQAELSRKVPVYQVVLEMVMNHLPNPLEAQKIRIPNIWGGDINTQSGQDMINCNKDGKVVLMITGMKIDPHAGEIATGRVYSGTVKKGVKVHLINSAKETILQQVGIYMSKTDRVQLEEIPAGNIAAISGLRDAYAGETVAEEKIKPFEAIKHYSEPVITKSVEAKNPKDLPKLIEALRQMAKEDPTVIISINEETGEHLISGMGELHLEILEYMIINDKKVAIETSAPIVVYRESIFGKSKEIESKSPNRHNKFHITVEPLEDEVYEAIASGEIPEGKIREAKTIAQKLREKGMNKDEVKKIMHIYNKCVLVDATKGIQYLNEIKELLIQAFEEATNAGPLAQERCTKIKVKLTDATLHEDAVHRGPAQIIPAFRRGIWASILMADPVMLEPKQKVFINIPQEYMGSVTNEIQGRRGQILEMNQEEDVLSVSTKVPVSEMFGFSAGMRSATQGRAIWTAEYAGYEKLPKNMQTEIIKKIRERKGLKAELPRPADLLE
jgi:elongation factor 2